MGAGSGASLAFGLLEHWAQQPASVSRRHRAYLGFRGKQSKALEACLASHMRRDCVRLTYSRHPTQPARHIDQLLAEDADWLRAMLAEPNACVYVCGSPGLAAMVYSGLQTITDRDGLAAMRTSNRFVVEAYGPA